MTRPVQVVVMSVLKYKSEPIHLYFIFSKKCSQYFNFLYFQYKFLYFLSQNVSLLQ